MIMHGLCRFDGDDARWACRAYKKRYGAPTLGFFTATIAQEASILILAITITDRLEYDLIRPTERRPIGALMPAEARE